MSEKFLTMAIQGEGVVKERGKRKFGSDPDSNLYWKSGINNKTFPKTPHGKTPIVSSNLYYPVGQSSRLRRGTLTTYNQLFKRFLRGSKMMYPVECGGEGSEWPRCPVSALSLPCMTPLGRVCPASCFGC